MYGSVGKNRLRLACTLRPPHGPPDRTRTLTNRDSPSEGTAEDTAEVTREDTEDNAGEATGLTPGQVTFLVEASRLLADSLDYATTLATVAGMALPHLGAWCFVDLLEPGRGMRRLAVIHSDPELQLLARQLEDGWPPERDDPLGVPRAVQTRQSEVITSVPDEMLVRASRSEENLRILRRLGIGSLMIVPLIARDQVLGAITYVSPRQGRGYTTRDLALAEALAARCAIAIDNAWLYAEARNAQRVAEEAKKAAEEANRAKSLFLATMSHEIRTPLNAVIGYVDLLQMGIGGPLSPDQARYLERVDASNRHLLGLINDVLDLAKVDAGQMQLQREESAAAPVVDAALNLVHPLTEGRAITLSAACEGDPDVKFVADMDRVRQILVNLLSNAIKFTPDGGRIRVLCGRSGPPERARLTTASPFWTYLQVADTGIGIAPGVQERLFEPFTQVDTGYTRSQEGTGLGLAISRRLARLMDGDLTVESEPEEGSVFTLWLPAPAHEMPPVEPTRDEVMRAPENIQGVAAIGRRMLAEADPIARTFVRRLRERRLVPHIDTLSDAAIQDHVASLLADLAQSMVLLEDSEDDAAELLRDGSAIQRIISDRHGVQRHRMGWTDEAVEAEFDILREEVEAVVSRAARAEEGADAARAMDLLSGFLQQARRGSSRAFRIARRRAGS